MGVFILKREWVGALLLSLWIRIPLFAARFPRAFFPNSFLFSSQTRPLPSSSFRPSFSYPLIHILDSL